MLAGAASLWCVCAAGLSACISSDSKVLNASEGCEEVRSTNAVPESLNIDPHVRLYTQAAIDLRGAAIDLRKQARQTCASVAADLGAPDSWSALGEGDESIANASGTGACDVAAQQVERLLNQGGQARALVAIDVARGDCHLDFEEQKRCDSACELNQICSPGTVETRCEPGSLSVKCDSACKVNAVCNGRPEKPCNCAGKCESTCMGECKGKCVAADGTVTENDPNCLGKCASSCKGQCKGHCKVEATAGINCGQEVRCTGGCEGSFREPVCVSQFNPPVCMVDEGCHAACSARVAAAAVCDPPVVHVAADVRTSPSLQPLVATLEKNLPMLLATGESHGKLALDAVSRMSAAGQVVGANVDKLDPKSLSCAGVASGIVSQVLASMQVSVKASSRVHLMVQQSSL
jgi:hypothetical protein